jgi:hypothetical protein
MRLAHEAGAEFPPIVIDKRSRRITDGFHRFRMYKMLEVEKVEVVEKAYKNEQAMFLDAIRLNAHHGKNLSPFDRTRCVIRAEALEIELDEVASALSLTTEQAGKLRAERVGRLRPSRSAKDGASREVPLKRMIGHMAGRTLTKGQSEVNDKLPGISQVGCVNTLVRLIESDMIDKENERLIEALRKLHGLLDGVLAAT